MQRILGEQIATLYFVAFKIFTRIEIFYLTGKAGFKKGSVETGDGRSGTFPGYSILPELADAIAKGVTAPSPVMTTLFISIDLWFFFYNYF